MLNYVPTRLGTDSSGSRFCAKLSSMVHRQPGLILPLMNHLMHERVHRLHPSVTIDVPATDHDLPALSRRLAMGVMPETTFHPARDANRRRREESSKLFPIVRFVCAAKPLSHRFVIGMALLRRATRLSIFDTVVKEGIPIAAVHLPFPGIGRLRKSGEAYVFDPAPWQLF